MEKSGQTPVISYPPGSGTQGVPVHGPTLVAFFSKWVPLIHSIRTDNNRERTFGLDKTGGLIILAEHEFAQKINSAFA